MAYGPYTVRGPPRSGSFVSGSFGRKIIRGKAKYSNYYAPIRYIVRDLLYDPRYRLDTSRAAYAFLKRRLQSAGLYTSRGMRYGAKRIAQAGFAGVAAYISHRAYKEVEKVVEPPGPATKQAVKVKWNRSSNKGRKKRRY